MNFHKGLTGGIRSLSLETHDGQNLPVRAKRAMRRVVLYICLFSSPACRNHSAARLQNLKKSDAKLVHLTLLLAVNLVFDLFYALAAL